MKREVFLLVALCAFVVNEAFSREWTDSTGKHKVVAKFVSADHGAVKLQREDGTIVAVEISRLSEADRKHVQLLQQPLRQARKSLMEERVTFNFNNVPLRDAMEQIAAQLRVPMCIVLPRSISPKSPVTGEADNEPLGQALHALLASIRADAQIKHEALVVDVREMVTIYPELRVYALPSGVSGQEIAKKIRMIDRHTWRQFGDRCDTLVWEDPPAILVTQSHLNHAIIRRRFPTLRLVEGTIPPVVTTDPIELALQRRIVVDFRDGRLDDLLLVLGKQAGVPIEFDHDTLERANYIFPSSETTLIIEGVTLESALNLLTLALTIDWRAKPTLSLTRTNFIGAILPERCHDLRGISFQPETLKYAVSMIDTDSWIGTGSRGVGKMRVEGDKLYAETTMANQQHIAQMLADLRELSQTLLAEK